MIRLFFLTGYTILYGEVDVLGKDLLSLGDCRFEEKLGYH